MALADTINAQVTTAKATAESILAQLNLTNSALIDAMDEYSALSLLGYTTLSDPDFGDLSVDVGDVPEAPDFLPLTAPELASSPEFDSLPVPSEITLPEFTEVAPARAGDPGSLVEGIEVPTLDSLVIPDVPDSPELTTFDFPDLDAVMLGLPAAPNLPDPGEYLEVLPTSDLEAPEVGFVYEEAEYTSALQTAASGWIQNIIAFGGTGLAPEVEQAIWERAVGREVRAARSTIYDAVDAFAGAGDTLPSGAARASLADVQNKLQDRLDELNKDISIEQARLAKSTTEFAITKALELEAVMVQHFDRVSERAYQVAKATSDLALAVYNAKVAEFNSRLERYRIGAQVHELRLKYGLQALENYRVLLQAKQLEGTLRQQELDLYIAKLSSQRELLERYKVQLQSTEVLGNLERLKIDAFRARIDGMQGELKKAEVDLGLRKVEADIYATDVSAYRTKAEVVRIQSDGIVAKANAELARLQGLIDIQKAKYLDVSERNKAILSKLSSEVEVNKALSTIYGVDAQVFTSKLNAAIANAETEIKKWDVVVEVRKANLAEMNARHRKEGDIFSSISQAKLDAAGSAVTSLSSAAAAALSQINTIAQLSSTEDLTA